MGLGLLASDLAVEDKQWHVAGKRRINRQDTLAGLFADSARRKPTSAKRGNYCVQILCLKPQTGHPLLS